MGFFKQVSGPFQINTEEFGGRKGNFKIGETYLKYFPAEIHSQTAIWAALEARKEIGDPKRDRIGRDCFLMSWLYNLGQGS